jgi:hypothetical protein
MTSAPVRDPLAGHLLTPQTRRCCSWAISPHRSLNMNDGGTHSAIRPYEPGEDWYWCYLDQLMFGLQGAPPAPSHP